MGEESSSWKTRVTQDWAFISVEWGTLFVRVNGCSRDRIIVAALCLSAMPFNAMVERSAYYKWYGFVGFKYTKQHPNKIQWCLQGINLPVIPLWQVFSPLLPMRRVAFVYLHIFESELLQEITHESRQNRHHCANAHLPGTNPRYDSDSKRDSNKLF